MGDVVWLNATEEVDEDDFSGQVVNWEFSGKTETPRSRPAEPIESLEQIERVRRYILYERKYRNEDMRLRDYLLFVLGINIGLRASDLRMLKVGDVLTPQGKLKRRIELVEEKTKETRKQKKYRVIDLNDAAIKALRRYLRGRPLDLNAPLFGNLSRNNSQKYLNTIAAKSTDGQQNVRRKSGLDVGLTTESISRILKAICAEAGVDVHASSHMLRKTFACQVRNKAKDPSRGLELTQNVMQHSSSGITLRYTGSVEKERREAYLSLNLGDEDEDMEHDDAVFTPRLVVCQ